VVHCDQLAKWEGCSLYCKEAITWDWGSNNSWGAAKLVDGWEGWGGGGGGGWATATRGAAAADAKACPAGMKWATGVLIVLGTTGGLIIMPSLMVRVG
jgi:hypothetical protein